jgi:two-component system, OmpR family, sensor histidine kinase KdpD
MIRPDPAGLPRHRVSTTRGLLRIYLGAGAGKTFALLTEGHLRVEQGTDVVVAYARTDAAGLLEGLEIIPPVTVPYGGSSFEEVDVDAVLARRPEVALLDDLAHSNVPGSRRTARWQEVAELLDAGIDVVSTVDIRHVDSLNDVVEAITGVRQRETVPDAIIRAADEVELVGIAMRPPPLHDAGASALHELALRWLVDKLRADPQRGRADSRSGAAREVRERVLVALTGSPNGETLIRRAARLAMRSGADLVTVHVARHGTEPAALVTQRRLVRSIGGGYHQVIGDDIAAALLAVARAMNATQMSWAAAITRGSRRFDPGPGSGRR